MHFKMQSAKWRSFRLGRNVLLIVSTITVATLSDQSVRVLYCIEKNVMVVLME